MSALELEGVIYKLLKDKTKFAVYNHVPDDAMAPFIRLGEINFRQWLIAPESVNAKLTIVIFSEEQSNQEVLRITEEVAQVIGENLSRANFPNIIHSEIINMNISQLKNMTWCGEMELEFKIIYTPLV
ncbi:MAG: hypothetical protein K0R73_1402 [Candidatus Midichloriaceae bacterium]|jgi:hypothetical protein|nr:hypothetical protein [Candidatus Midichloriaceae bacterium]